jgi:hypothetical protein
MNVFERLWRAARSTQPKPEGGAGMTAPSTQRISAVTPPPHFNVDDVDEPSEFGNMVVSLLSLDVDGWNCNVELNHFYHEKVGTLLITEDAHVRHAGLTDMGSYTARGVRVLTGYDQREILAQMKYWLSSVPPAVQKPNPVPQQAHKQSLPSFVSSGASGGGGHSAIEILDKQGQNVGAMQDYQNQIASAMARAADQHVAQVYGASLASAHQADALKYATMPIVYK